ncbi:hypothetical protein GCM10011385_34430 [Nitratireductor aestuarii]|uniref:DUF6644 domain-containing protein n=1 Tax=Nitratireductor aestuarii TaxID=1735103 RepID=A0A916W8B8_9HYPH|nr:DUF6644 family protein [Nitratireductor aestuarii]GGA77421.1 hypothetical protein GCM10011385_34430 [Nitratireductor aestuarii]
MLELFNWLSGSALAQTLTMSPRLYMFVNAAHILSIGILVGAIIPLDLRVLGFFRSVPLNIIGPFLSQTAMVGTALTVAFGVMLFSVRTKEYAANPAFLAKMALLALGVANALLFQVFAPWRQRPVQNCPTALVRVMAGLSLVTWISAVIAGRWIGFV